MAHSKGNKGNGNKGFGSMSEERQREIASEGGRASAQSNTSNRGFASMDKDKQREISSQGGRASHGPSGKHQGSSGVTREDEDLKTVTGATDVSRRNKNSFEDEDRLLPDSEDIDESYSETDEDEDEGLGDGNIGRSKSNELGS
jgi:hypothetical protein